MAQGLTHLDNEISDQFDHLDPGVASAEVRVLFNEMQERCPVVRDSRYGWSMITRYEDVRRALRQGDVLSTSSGISKPLHGWGTLFALEKDEPHHSRDLRLLEPVLSAAAIHASEPLMRKVADHFIDQFAATGTADLVGDFCEYAAAVTIGRMIGLTVEESIVNRSLAMEAFAAQAGPEMFDKIDAFRAFVQKKLDERRRDPGHDYLSALASGELGGHAITDQDVFDIFVGLLVAGHHSTSSAMASLMHYVLTVPGLRETVRTDRAALSRAVEETLRMTTPLPMFLRTARSSVSFGDQEVAEGDALYLNYAAANRDPRRFDDPNTFNPDRRSIQHFAFGAGMHKCVGQHLARAELRTSLLRLLERLPDIHVTGEVRESGLVGGAIFMLESLPVAFTPVQGPVADSSMGMTS